MHKAIPVLAVIALILMPGVAFAHGGTEVTVRGEVRADGPIEVKGDTFDPGETVKVALMKDGVEPLLLGYAVADETGHFSSTLHVPSTVPPALYRLVAEGKRFATTEVRVLAAAQGAAQSMPATAAREPVSNERPLAETIGLAAATAAVGAAGAGLLLLSERRSGRVRQGESS